ncbi:hypothetical protein GE061_010965 [Apolygus lucorum]|uniref:histone acetyltransferase n=1 Tax=Apolygus lucorum TaxID=248454 RepID=A0A6A4K3V3_APOLU|nr:hypothetical protein GE061_010965 [Apolygus lucorum]
MAACNDPLSQVLTNPENVKRVQQQLVLLAHAEMCRRKRGSYPNMKCCTPYCPLLIEVLTHLNSCMVGTSCSTPHCYSSRSIITHYQRCKNRTVHCPVCDTLKTLQNSESSERSIPEDLFEPYFFAF